MIATISPARMVAAKLLDLVECDHRLHANDALMRLGAEEDMRLDDLRLARTIAFGVMRNGLMLDYLYGELLSKPVETMDHRLRLCLRMAAFQKMMLDRVPDYAIVNETVEVGRRVFGLAQKQVGFLNAVVRKMVTEPLTRALPEGNRVRDLSVRFSYPKPFVDILVQKYGTHKTITLLEACNEEPALVARTNTLVTNRDGLVRGLEERGVKCKQGYICPDALVLDGSGIADGGSIFELDLFLDGHFYVQDEASQLVAYIVAPMEGERILDLCAAPGGKTTHMAELGGGLAHITATDLLDERLKLVSENVTRLRSPGVATVPLNIATGTDKLYDAVLVDAPCSGMGTVRRNPEIRYRINEDRLSRHGERQIDVLRLAAKHVRPGGRMVYSTCSVSDQENSGVINRFLRECGEFSVWREGYGPVVQGLVQGDGFVRTWPDWRGVDGFEAVVLRRG